MEVIKSAGITATGMYLPEKVFKNTDLEKILPTSDEWIVQKVGIRERRLVDDNEALSDIAIKAVQDMIKNYNLDPLGIDLIIVSGHYHDMIMPSTATIVQNGIGAKNAAAFDIRAGCAGFIFGMTLARRFIADGTYKKVVVIGAEIHSKMIDWKNYRDAVFFGDGAGAVLLEEVPEGYGILSDYLTSDGSKWPVLRVESGGSRYPIKNGGGSDSPYLFMDAKEMWNYATWAFEYTVQQVLKKAKLTTDAIDWVIPHQANINMMKDASKKLHIPMEKFLKTLEYYGNSASATIPITYHQYKMDNCFKKGEIIAMTSFGAGLSAGAILMRHF